MATLVERLRAGGHYRDDEGCLTCEAADRIKELERWGPAARDEIARAAVLERHEREQHPTCACSPFTAEANPVCTCPTFRDVGGVERTGLADLTCPIHGAAARSS